MSHKEHTYVYWHSADIFDHYSGLEALPPSSLETAKKLFIDMMIREELFTTGHDISDTPPVEKIPGTSEVVFSQDTGPSEICFYAHFINLKEA